MIAPAAGARRWAWFALLLALAVADVLIFNRVALLSGLDSVPGDLGDGRFNLAVLEHWHRVALGQEGWASPGYFYPAPRTLAYSDALVLLAPAYVAARLAGSGMVPALALTLMVASSLGFAGMLVFLRRLLGLPWPAALAGAAAFATQTALSQSLVVGHVQMLAVEAIPWFAVLAWLYGRDGGRWAGVGAALLLACLLLTSFYAGWFLLLQLLVLAGLGAALAVGSGFGGGAAARDWLSRHGSSLPWVAAALALGLAPFLLLYGPLALHGAGRPWAEVVRSLPDAAEFLDVRGNALWGPVAEALSPGLTLRGGELGKGLSWGLLAVFAITLVRLTAGPVSGIAPGVRRLALLLGGSTVLCGLAMLQVEGRSAWELVYQLVPGGQGIRSVVRFNLVLSFSVAAVAAIGLGAAWSRAGRLARPGPARLAVGLVAAGLAVEQLNTLPGTLSGSRDFAAIEALGPPPPGCRALVMLSSLPDTYHRWSRQLAAVMAAQTWGLPTLNGYSGLAPPDWALFDPADPKAYRRALVAWADRTRVWDGLCGVDLEARRWFPLSRNDLVR